MARAVAKCVCEKCGDTFEMIKRNCLNSADALSWEEWARENITVCEDCKRKEREKSVADMVTVFETTHDVAELQGSVKQVAWARRIRAMLCLAFSGACKELEAGGKNLVNRCYREDHAAMAAIKDFASAIFKGLCNEKSAKVFIDSWSNISSEATAAEECKRVIDAFQRCSLQISNISSSYKRYANTKKDDAQAPEKPSRPAFIAGNWNGKIYGTKSPYSIYVDGKKLVLTAAQYAEIQDYTSKCSLYREITAAIAEGVDCSEKIEKLMQPFVYEAPEAETNPEPENKAEWLSININDNLIEVSAGNAVKIKMPHRSHYDGFVFWHPSKLIREGRHSASVSLSYTRDYEFHLKKYGKGRYNSRTVLEEKTITAEEFEEAFGVIDGNISAPVEKPLLHVPAVLEPEAAIVPDELLDTDDDPDGSRHFLATHGYL